MLCTTTTKELTYSPLKIPILFVIKIPLLLGSGVHKKTIKNQTIL